MKESKLLKFDKKVLVAAVNIARRKQLVGDGGRTWEQFLASQDPKNKFNDPARHAAERLAAFLSSLTEQLQDPKYPDRAAIKKPKKLLKALLPWLQKRQQEDQILSAAQKPTNAEAAAVALLVQQSRRHPRFKAKYDFPSYGKGWLSTDRLPLPDADAAPTLLGLDCEMCRTAENDKEVIQVALVDAQGRKILQELVKPDSPVLDYRTELTGLKAADLEDVQTDRQTVAARIKALLTPGTVLVGHSLHYDLGALLLDHQPVIDTAMIFSYQGLASATPALTVLADQLLGRKLRGTTVSDVTGGQQLPHDSVEDAAASMALVQEELHRLISGQGPTPPLQPPEVKIDRQELAKLCIHKIPAATSAAAVRAAVAAAVQKAGQSNDAVAAVEAAGLEEGAAGKQLVMLVLKHPGQANDVFSALPGRMFTDSVGRHSKRLQLPDSRGQVVVRKMACHNGLAYGKDQLKDRGMKNPKGKKRKAGATLKAGSKRRNSKK